MLSCNLNIIWCAFGLPSTFITLWEWNILQIFWKYYLSKLPYAYFFKENFRLYQMWLIRIFLSDWLWLKYSYKSNSIDYLILYFNVEIDSMQCCYTPCCCGLKKKFFTYKASYEFCLPYLPVLFNGMALMEWSLNIWTEHVRIQSCMHRIKECTELIHYQYFSVIEQLKHIFSWLFSSWDMYTVMLWDIKTTSLGNRKSCPDLKCVSLFMDLLVKLLCHPDFRDLEHSI